MQFAQNKTMMKRMLWVGVFAAMAGSANAGCFDSLTTASSVNSKIRGMYVNAAGSSTYQYVILDKATCQASAGDATLGSGTKSAHYLAFKADDKTMLAVLLNAQATGAVVQFRLNPNPASVVDGYNQIAYVISPASALQ